MALPITFATLPGGPQPLQDFDTQFAAVAALGSIPCVAAGVNTLALTPFINTPTVSAYTDLAPSFIFVAPATSTGDVTINVNGLGVKNALKANGFLFVGAGDLIAGAVYRAAYYSGLPGFVVDAMSGPSLNNATIEFIIDGGGSPITTGVKGYLKIGYPASISAWEVMGDQSGSIAIDILRLNGGVPVTSMIGGGTKPNLSAQQFAVGVPPVGWTSTLLAESDWLGFNVTSASTVTRVTLALDLGKL
jgi:hypothetical protein